MEQDKNAKHATTESQFVDSNGKSYPLMSTEAILAAQKDWKSYDINSPNISEDDKRLLMQVQQEVDNLQECRRKLLVQAEKVRYRLKFLERAEQEVLGNVNQS